jgi:hypothetical protein
MSEWYAELAQNTLRRGLLLVGAAVHFRQDDSDVKARYQLTPAFADLFSTSAAGPKADAIRTFQDAAVCDYGFDIRVEQKWLGLSEQFYVCF